MPRQYSSSLVEFVKLLMCDDEALRPTFADLMELREELLAASLAYEPTTRDFSFNSLSSSAASSPFPVQPDISLMNFPLHLEDTDSLGPYIDEWV